MEQMTPKECIIYLKSHLPFQQTIDEDNAHYALFGNILYRISTHPLTIDISKKCKNYKKHFFQFRDDYVSVTGDLYKIDNGGIEEIFDTRRSEKEMKEILNSIIRMARKINSNGRINK